MIKIKNKINAMLKNDFFNHSKNYIIADFFSLGLSFITLPIFTRLLLPNEYGIISVFNSIISIFTILMGLNFHGAISRKYYETDDDFKSYLGSNIMFLLVLNIFLAIICFLFKDVLSRIFSIDSKLFFLAVLLSSFSFFIQIELTYLQVAQKSKKYAILSIIRGFIITLTGLVWTWVLKDERYLGKIYSQFIVTGIIFLFVLYNLKKISKFQFEFKHIKYSLIFAIPLIPHALSGFILNEFDRLMINRMSGNYDTGIYSFAYSVGSIMMVFVGATNKSWTPIFFECIKNDNYERLGTIAEKYTKIIFIIALSFILFSKEIVMLLADEKYYSSLKIVPLIVISNVFIFLYTLYGGYAFYRKKTWLISIFTFIAGAVNIGLNYLFIPRYGYLAAAWTTLASYILLFVLHYSNSRFLMKERVISMRKIFLDLILLLILIIFSIKLFENKVNFITFLGKILFLLLSIVMILRKKIKRL